MEQLKKEKKKRRTQETTLEQALADPEKNLKLDEMRLEDSSEYEEYSEESAYESMSYEEGEKEEEPQEEGVKRVEIMNEVPEEENLDFDNEAYQMLHRAEPEWPCMTIDFILEDRYFPPTDAFFKQNKQKEMTYPFGCSMVSGAFTGDSKNGLLYCMKWENMHKTMYDGDPDKEDDSQEQIEPTMRVAKQKIKGNVLRLKTMRNSYIAAYWSDSPSIEIVDLRPLLTGFETVEETDKKKKKEEKRIKLASFPKKLEGFGLSWSETTPGYLCIGGEERNLELYGPNSSMTGWSILGNFKRAHDSAIEDVIFSPEDPNLLASCSCDRSVKVWDMRAPSKAAFEIVNAHESDVNVISWNRFTSNLIASGGDDAAFKSWDFRYLETGSISKHLWHKGPICALEWDPFDRAQIAVASEDNKLSIWDFSIESDNVDLVDQNNEMVPAELVFLHQGQKDLKDLKWHPTIQNVLVSTAANGINVFSPAFDDTDSIHEAEI